MSPATTRITHDETTRATVRHLAEQDLSNREIARQTGVSEATVRRWRKTDAPATHPDAALDAPGDALTVALDADLRDDLATLAEAGLTADAAVTLAVQMLADAYCSAWDYGDTPRGTAPRVHAHAAGAPTPVCVPHRPATRPEGSCRTARDHA